MYDFVLVFVFDVFVEFFVVDVIELDGIIGGFKIGIVLLDLGIGIVELVNWLVLFVVVRVVL